MTFIWFEPECFVTLIIFKTHGALHGIAQGASHGIVQCSPYGVQGAPHGVHGVH